MAFGNHTPPTLAQALDQAAKRDELFEQALEGNPESKAAALAWWLGDTCAANERIAKAARDNEILIHPAYQEPTS